MWLWTRCTVLDVVNAVFNTAIKKALRQNFIVPVKCLCYPYACPAIIAIRTGASVRQPMGVATLITSINLSYSFFAGSVGRLAIGECGAMRTSSLRPNSHRASHRTHGRILILNFCVWSREKRCVARARKLPDSAGPHYGRETIFTVRGKLREKRV